MKTKKKINKTKAFASSQRQWDAQNVSIDYRDFEKDTVNLMGGYKCPNEKFNRHKDFFKD